MFRKANREWPGVFVATPTTRAFELGFVQSLVGDGYPGRRFWGTIQNQAADIARNMLVEDFLKSDYEYILFVDSDATWSPRAIERLVERERDVICGVFFKRDIPPVPTIGTDGGSSIEGRRMYDFGVTMRAIKRTVDAAELWEQHVVNDLVLPMERGKDLLQIDGCGMHFVLVKREVVERIEKPWFACTTRGAGEDFYFCRKVAEAGFDLWCDLTVYTGHINGALNIGLRQFLMYYEGREMPEEEVWKV